MTKVVISIINYNKSSITNSCLKSLNDLDQKGFDVYVVVIDNASKETLSLDKKAFPNLQLTLINSKVNTGFSGGHNIGFRHAFEHNAEYVVILNNDTTVDNQLLQKLIASGSEREDAGIIAPKIYFSKGSEFHSDRYSNSEKGHVLWYAGGEIDWNNMYWKHRGVDEVDKGQFEKTEETDFASGCCFAIKTSTLKKIGLFDERYFLYYEDSDLNERAKRSGYRIFYEPQAMLWHQNAGSTGGSGSPLQDYFTTRNRLLLGYTYASNRTKIALFRESMRILHRGREWQKKGVKDFYKRNFGKGSYNV